MVNINKMREMAADAANCGEFNDLPEFKESLYNIADGNVEGEFPFEKLNYDNLYLWAEMLADSIKE